MADQRSDPSRGHDDPDEQPHAPPEGGDLDDVVRRAGELLTDAAEVTVGLALLAVNRLQVIRRSLTTVSDDRRDPGTTPEDPTR